MMPTHYSFKSYNNRRAATILTLVLFIAIILRMWFVIGAQPVIGFANNFDFIRQSACIGLWEDYGDRAKDRPHREGPAPRLVFDGDRRQYYCLKSIDNVFPYLAAHAHRKHDLVDLREVGFWKGFFAILACALLLLQRMPPYARVFMALATFLCIGDLETLSYANTLYLEFSVILASTLALATCALLGAQSAPPRLRDLWLPAVSFAWLGLTKQQYGGLATVMAVIAAWILLSKWRQRRSAALLLAVGLAAPISFNAINDTPWGLVGAASDANHADTFLGTVLPAATDVGSALKMLGMPDACRSAVGENWYTRGFQTHDPCPAVRHVSRLRLLRLFLSQPTTFTIPMAHAVALTQPSHHNDMQRFEQPTDATRIRYRVLWTTSPTWVFARLPPVLYRALVAAAMLACPIALGLRLLWLTRCPNRASPRTQLGLSMLSMGSIAVFYTIASTVFGDGYQDVRRHAAVLPVGLTFVAIGCMCWIFESIRSTDPRTSIVKDRRGADPAIAVETNRNFPDHRAAGFYRTCRRALHILGLPGAYCRCSHPSRPR